MKNILPPKVTDTTNAALSKLKRYKIVLFVVLVAGVYGYVILTISSLANVQPSPDQVSVQTNRIQSAKLDKKVIAQLQHLQDNSVSVKALFDEARSNPFQEN